MSLCPSFLTLEGPQTLLYIRKTSLEEASANPLWALTPAELWVRSMDGEGWKLSRTSHPTLMGLVSFIFVLFLQEQTANIHGDNIRMPGNPNKDDRCVLLWKKQMFIKMSAKWLTCHWLWGQHSNEKAIIMKNGHSSLLNDSWHPCQNGHFCCSPSSVVVAGISVAQDSYLFPVLRSIGQTSYLEMDTGCFIVLTFLFPQWFCIKGYWPL